MIPDQYRERLRTRLSEARGALLSAHAATRGLCEEHGELRGSDAELEGQITSAIATVEVAQRLVRRLPPGERFEIAIDTLADAVDPCRVGGPENAPNLLEAASAVLEANHDVQTASGRTGDGSIRD